MTRRVQGLVVTLAEDMREDDAARTIAAVERIKGVRSVDVIDADADSHIARVRVRSEVAHRLRSIAHELEQVK